MCVGETPPQATKLYKPKIGSFTLHTDRNKTIQDSQHFSDVVDI